MKFNEIKATESRYYSSVFNRLPVAITRGSGVYVWNNNNQRYLDFFSGIAVNATGHCHPTVVKAIKKQAETLMHTSNWVYTTPQLKLAEKLVKLTRQDKVFLTNDGTETIECAIKIARKVSGKTEIIAMKNSFHGRTMGSLSLTWNEKFKKPFKPMLPGATFVEYNNIKALRKAVSRKTAAVIVEPIQGEAGVIIPDDGYLTAVRELTEKKNILMILDEVQTGFGRTGKMFAYEYEKVTPDILCLAKAMGSGFPIGATLFNSFDFKQSEHGGTFLGNPLACSAALASIDVIKKQKLAENSNKIGKTIMEKLRAINLDARGRGLMIGVKSADGKKTVLELLEKRVLTIYSDNTVRILPPLIVNKKHVKTFVNKAGEVRW